MVNVDAQAPEGLTLEQVVDLELEAFEQFFIEKLKNTRMTPSERAILKTYLHWAAVDKKKG